MHEKTILLVFGERDLSLVFRYAIQKYGFTVLQAENTSAAESLLSSSKPNLIFIGHWVGDESGIQFVKNLRKQADSKRIPIMMYIVGNKEHIDEANDAGVDVVFTMPFDLNNIVSAIQSLLL